MWPSSAQPTFIYLIFPLQQICCLPRAHPPHWPPQRCKKNLGQIMEPTEKQTDRQTDKQIYRVRCWVASQLKIYENTQICFEYWNNFEGNLTRLILIESKPMKIALFLLKNKQERLWSNKLGPYYSVWV